MGSIFSIFSSRASSQDEEAPAVVDTWKPPSYRGTKRTPIVASLHPEDCGDLYAWIHDLIEVVPHQDRTSVIVFSSGDPDDQGPRDRSWLMGPEFVRHMRRINERLAKAGSHPRIVK